MSDQISMTWRTALIKLAKITFGIAGLSAAVIVAEVLIAMREPTAEYIAPSRQPMQFGNSDESPLRYVVMGDSTAAGQGVLYKDSIAIRTAEFLAKDRNVSMVNLGVSGAVTSDVVSVQLPLALTLHPDIVLLCVGSNDVTHFTPLASLSRSIDRILTSFNTLPNPPIVVVTGAADLGSVPRFLEPLKSIATARSIACNRIFRTEALKRNAVWCNLGEQTGPAFRHDPTLFGSDRFHPNERGYGVWVNIIEPGLTEALRRIELRRLQ